MGASPAVVAGAIVAGKPPQCPRFRGFWAFSEGTERAYPQRCNRWDCSYCGKWKRLVARFALARGVALALEQGERVRFVTLTDPSGKMTR